MCTELVPKRNGLVAYVSALFGLASQFALGKVTSHKRLFNTSFPRYRYRNPICLG